MPIGPPTYTPQQAHQALIRFIRHERYMRERVFASSPTKLDGKLAECDNALAALNVLRQAANVPAPELPQAEQPGLFGGA